MNKISFEDNTDPDAEHSSYEKLPCSPFASLEIHESFKHYRSVSYAQAIQNLSSSSSFKMGIDTQYSSYSTSEHMLAKPSSPKTAPPSPQQMQEALKCSTLPSKGSRGFFNLQNKFTSYSLSSFFKKLSPKLHRNANSKLKNQPWIVIEFSQDDIEGKWSDNTSMASDRSFEMAAKSKEEYLSSLKCMKESAHKGSQLAIGHGRTRKNTLRSPDSSNEKQFDEFKICTFKKNIKPKSDSCEKSFLSRFSPKKPLQDMKQVLKHVKKNNKPLQCKTQPTLKSPVVDNSTEKETQSRHALPKDKEQLNVFQVIISEDTLDSQSQGNYVAKSGKSTSPLLLPATPHIVMPLVENVAYTPSGLQNALSASPSFDASSFLLTPEFSLRPRKVQPPKTLSLQSKIFVHSPQMDRASNKMASIESIGACSLDVEGSESSCNSVREDVTVSERTLQSASVVISSGGSASRSAAEISKDNGFNSSVTEHRRFRTHTFLFIPAESKSSPSVNGHVKEECTVAEIKLPSYVSISCAINGYTNYSRFCRSRDNSPARIAFNKLSTYKGQEESPGHATSNGQSVVADQHSVCSKSSHLYMESKELAVRKQLQVPVKTTKTYTASQEIVIGSDLEGRNIIRDSVSVHESDSLVNGHGNEVHTLAQEVGDTESKHKSLVQQRIESLYGESACEGSKIFTYRVSRLKTPLDISSERNGIQVTKRSPSCPPQSSRSQSRSPPVFRHLKKDFREQLRGSSSYPQPNKMSWHMKRNSINSSTHLMTASLKENKENKIELSPQLSVIQANTHITELNMPDSVFTQTATLCEPSKDIESSKTKGSLYSTKPLLPPKPPSLSQHASPVLSSRDSIATPSSEKDGHKFLAVMDTVKEEIRCKITEMEELQDSNIPEDACGKIRAAVGKANLLLSQKFEQFKELCYKNITEAPTDPFYTTSSDLAGFWDMVLLQVADVNATFDEINEMKANNWKEVLPKKEIHIPAKAKRSPAKGASKSNPSTPKRSTKATEMARAREQARKELIAAKKRGRQQQNSGQEEAEIAIFTPDSAN